MEKELKISIDEIKNADIKIANAEIITVNDIEKINNTDNKYIYAIKGTPVKLFNINEIKSKISEFKIPKYNDKNTDKTLIYIGSSQDIKNRLKQHFIKNNNKTTYSLHMDKWNNNEEFFKDIKIYLYKFDVGMEIVKAIEVKFAKKLKPILGQTCVR